MTLALTSFAQGPDDNLATVDIYNKTDSSTVNNRPNIEETLQALKLNTLSPSKAILDNLKIVKGKDNNGLLIDKDALVKGILSSSNGVMGAFRSLSQVAQDKLLQTDEYNKIKMTLNEVDQYVSNTDASTLRALALLIKGISGCSFPISFKDEHGIYILGANIIEQSSKLGMWQSYHAFIECMDDKYIGSKITKKLMPYIVSSSNTNLFKEIATGNHRQEVIDYYPSVLTDYTTNYKLPINTNQSDYEKIFSDIITIYDGINPSWKTKNLNGQQILNSSTFINASNDFIKLINYKTNSKTYNISTPNTCDQLDDLDKLCSSALIANQAKKVNYNLYKNPLSCLKDDFKHVFI